MSALKALLSKLTGKDTDDENPLDVQPAGSNPTMDGSEQSPPDPQGLGPLTIATLQGLGADTQTAAPALPATNNLPSDTSGAPIASHIDQVGQGIGKAFSDGNPFEMVGNTVNALAPRGTNGEVATENPNSLLSILKSALPQSISHIAPLNAASRILGLGSLQPPTDTNGDDTFSNSNQSTTSFDSKIIADQKKMSNDAAVAGYSDLGKSRYEADQTQLAADKANRDLELSTRQGAGIATPSQADDYREKGQGAQAIVDSTKQLQTTLVGQNPQQAEAALSELRKQGNLSENVRRGLSDAGLMQAASEGTVFKYISDPKNVAVASAVKGALKGAYDNAVIEANAVERQAGQLFPGLRSDKDGNYDTTTREYQIAKKLAPTLGEKVGIPSGLPSREDFNKVVDNLGEGENNFNEQGVKQSGDIGTATGEAGTASTVGFVSGILKQAPASARDGIVAVANHYSPGSGDAALKQLKKVASDAGNSPALNAPNKADTSSIPPKARALGITAEQWAKVVASKDPKDIAYVAKFK